jgi:hypothetical protein
MFQHSLNRTTFSGLGIEIRYLLHAREGPDVASFSFDFGARFVDMEKVSLTEALQNSMVRGLIELCRSRLEPMDSAPSDGKAEQLIYTGRNPALRQA